MRNEHRLPIKCSFEGLFSRALRGFVLLFDPQLTDLLNSQLCRLSRASLGHELLKSRPTGALSQG